MTQAPSDQTGTLHLTMQDNVMTSNMITPTVLLNRWEVPVLAIIFGMIALTVIG